MNDKSMRRYITPFLCFLMITQSCLAVKPNDNPDTKPRNKKKAAITATITGITGVTLVTLVAVAYKCLSQSKPTLAPVFTPSPTTPENINSADNLNELSGDATDNSADMVAKGENIITSVSRTLVGEPGGGFGGVEVGTTFPPQDSLDNKISSLINFINSTNPDYEKNDMKNYFYPYTRGIECGITQFIGGDEKKGKIPFKMPAGCEVFGDEDSLNAIFEKNKNLSQNSGRWVIDLGKLEGNVHVIGDLHGDLDATKAQLTYFLQKLKENSNDKLIVLGDFVDRGIYWRECATILLKLQNEFPDNVYILMGNHEAQLYNDFSRISFPMLFGEDSGSSKVLFPVSITASIGGKNVVFLHGSVSKEMYTGNFPENLKEKLWNLDTESENDLNRVQKSAFCEVNYYCVRPPITGTTDVYESNHWEDKSGRFNITKQLFGEFLKKNKIDFCVTGHVHKNAIYLGDEKENPWHHITLLSAIDFIKEGKNGSVLLTINPEEVSENKVSMNIVRSRDNKKGETVEVDLSSSEVVENGRNPSGYRFG